MSKQRPWRSAGGCRAGTPVELQRDATGRAPLTDRQAEVVQAIREHVHEHGWPPTMRDLAARFGWSGPSAAFQQLAYIERKGWIVRLPGASRAIRIVGE